MDGLVEVVLRLTGAFYVFAGFIATRAAAMSQLLDTAIAGIEGKKPTPKERALMAWLTATGAVVFAGGLALLLLVDVAPWLFVVSALGQLAFITLLAPRYFDVDEEPNPKGRQQTINAFVIYLAATAFVILAVPAGILKRVDALSMVELAIAGAMLVAYVVWWARGLLKR